MIIVQQHIARHQARFREHPFFARLDAARSIDQLAPFPLCLTFFVMTFQDMLRINEERVTDPEIKRLVHQHRIEDAGHDRWFLADLATLGLEAPSTQQLFDRSHQVVRHASLALAAETAFASHDACRLTLLLALESTGHVVFERVANLLERVGDTRRLKYFSRYHLDVEKAHDLFEEKTDTQIEAIVLTPEVRSEALAVVDRCYVAFNAMFDEINKQIATRSFVPPPSMRHQQEERGSTT